jgi:hypothetical protein
MTAVIFPNAETEPAIVYGSEDGEPLAETYVHLMAIVAITAVLKHYLLNVIAMLHCEMAEAHTAMSQSNMALSQSKELAEAEVDRLREKLRALGIDPD